MPAMEKRWIVLVFIFQQIFSYTSAMCEKKKSSHRISFENSEGFACDMKQYLYFNDGYLRINVVQIQLEPSGILNIYGNPLITDNTSCIIVTASGSRCVKEEDFVGCTRLEKNEGAAAFHFVSTAAGEYVALSFSEEACERNSESNMTEAATYSTDAVERISVTNTTKSATSAAPSLNLTAPSRLPAGRGLERPAVTKRSAMRANETSAAMQTTLVEQEAIGSMSRAIIVLIIGVVCMILGILAMLRISVRRRRTKRKVSVTSDGINPTSISVISPKGTLQKVYEDDCVNIAVTSPDYRKDTWFSLPDTLRYCNVTTTITPQQNLDYEVIGPVVPKGVNKPAPNPFNLGIPDSEYTLMAPAFPVTPRIQSFNNSVQVDPQYVVMSPACSKSQRQQVFENVRLKSNSAQSHDQKFVLDQETTPKSAEPHFPTKLGGTIMNRANEDPMYVDMAPARTITDVTHHEPTIFGH